jgi:hypothetical protein
MREVHLCRTWRLEHPPRKPVEQGLDPKYDATHIPANFQDASDFR